MRPLLFIPCLLACTLALAPAQAVVLEGQRFDERARLADHELHLNGLGVRAAWIFKAFVAALYVPEKTRDAQQILDRDAPRRLQLRMLMDVGPGEIKKALVRGMQKNASEAEWAALQARAEDFSRTIDSIGPAREGDTINLDYLPGRGLTLAVNDVPRGQVIAGADFYEALLGIFVGPHPVDTRLKRGLLGQ
jgi:hypothetical protein